MTKNELVKEMAEKAGVSVADAQKCLDGFTSSVTDALKRKDKLTLVGFGTFETKDRFFAIIAHDLRGMIIPFQRSGKILKHHINKGNHERTIELSQELEKNSESLLLRST